MQVDNNATGHRRRLPQSGYFLLSLRSQVSLIKQNRSIFTQKQYLLEEHSTSTSSAGLTKHLLIRSMFESSIHYILLLYPSICRDCTQMDKLGLMCAYESKPACVCIFVYATLTHWSNLMSTVIMSTAALGSARSLIHYPQKPQ